MLLLKPSKPTPTTIRIRKNRTMRHLPTLIVALTILISATDSQAQGPGRGRGPGFRGGGQHGHDARHDADHDVFHFLLTNHKKIHRTVKNLPDGVETLTESDDAEVAAGIKAHVKWMQVRVDKVQPIRMRDPLFREIFKHADKISMKRVETPKGVRVTETSKDPYVARLIQAHATAVSGFVKRGFAEAMKNHEVPTATQSESGIEYSHPKIAGYGKVVRMPEASEQPRDGSRICVDITAGGEPDQLFPSVAKVARFVNLYAGGGNEPAGVDITIVLHGDATLAVLNGDEYSRRFKTRDNPNFDCLHKLHEAGVEIVVCGQSLAKHGAGKKDVLVFADVAVSALTALVNRQSDGYAYVPLAR